MWRQQGNNSTKTSRAKSFIPKAQQVVSSKINLREMLEQKLFSTIFSQEIEKTTMNTKCKTQNPDQKAKTLESLQSFCCHGQKKQKVNLKEV